MGTCGEGKERYAAVVTALLCCVLWTTSLAQRWCPGTLTLDWLEEARKKLQQAWRCWAELPEK